MKAFRDIIGGCDSTLDSTGGGGAAATLQESKRLLNDSTHLLTVTEHATSGSVVVEIQEPSTKDTSN